MVEYPLTARYKPIFAYYRPIDRYCFPISYILISVATFLKTRLTTGQ